ncbi:MAG: DUF1552 domain-containing protein [Bryobacter sp.]|nr:DUF1552 domain-containing protein [Bryobacter sp.]
MKQPLSRRNVLRGLGVSLALPWLESAQAENLAEAPRRLAYIFMPNGVWPADWTPEGDGEEFALTRHLKPLAGLQQDILLVENLWNKNTVGRNGHWPKVPAWLSGGFVERTTGGDLDAGGTTIDQFIAQRLAPGTPLQTLELGIDPPRTGIDTAGGGFPRALGSFLSWADAKTPVPKEIVPQIAFDRLFRNQRKRAVSGANPQDPAVLASLERDDTSVLDLAREDALALKKRASRADQARLDEYFESVRSVERRLEDSLRPQKRWINAGKFPLDRPVAGIPQTHVEHVRLMFDILLLAFWTDSTRIATFMMGDAQSSKDYSFLPGVKGNFHSLSHHRELPEQREQYQRIVDWNVEQLAWFLNKAKALNEGGRPLLDNAMIVFGSSLKDGNRHTEENLPLLIAGKGKGAIRTGRRIRAEAKTPYCNLHLKMAHLMGVEADGFGDATGPLGGLS